VSYRQSDSALVWTAGWLADKVHLAHTLMLADITQIDAMKWVKIGNALRDHQIFVVHG
jgi:hypothetical protein